MGKKQQGEPVEKNKVKGIGEAAVIWTVLLILLVLILSATPPGRQLWHRLYGNSDFVSSAEAPLNIHVLDVGKADAILIECEGHSALVDAGTYLHGETVVDYLKRNGFSAVDYAIVTHPDKDHIGGMAQVLSEVSAGTFIWSGYFPEEYAPVRKLLADQAVPERVAASGDVLQLGGAALEILGPLREYEETNDASLVFRLEYQGFAALFCGDIENEAERDLAKSGADLSADLLKVAHHGSKTSSNRRFLEVVKPRYAVISVGPDKNELPDEKVLTRLFNMGAEIYQTDTDGIVIFSYDGEKVSVHTEKRRDKSE